MARFCAKDETHADRRDRSVVNYRQNLAGEGEETDRGSNDSYPEHGGAVCRLAAGEANELRMW
jgi:hypothetical protein